MDLKLHPESEQELYEDAAYYDDERPLLGDEFLAKIYESFERILERPHMYPRWPATPAVEPAIRRFVVDRFPYCIGYQVYDEHVLILAVAHTSRRPSYWLHRP